MLTLNPPENSASGMSSLSFTKCFSKKLNSFSLSLFHVLFRLQGDVQEVEIHSSFFNNTKLSEKVGVDLGPAALFLAL